MRGGRRRVRVVHHSAPARSLVWDSVTGPRMNGCWGGCFVEKKRSGAAHRCVARPDSPVSSYVRWICGSVRFVRIVPSGMLCGGGDTSHCWQATEGRLKCWCTLRNLWPCQWQAGPAALVLPTLSGSHSRIRSTAVFKNLSIICWL